MPDSLGRSPRMKRVMRFARRRVRVAPDAERKEALLFAAGPTVGYSVVQWFSSFF